MFKKRGDKPLPTKKVDLIAVNKTAINDPSPQVSPGSSMVHSGSVERDGNCSVEDRDDGGRRQIERRRRGGGGVRHMGICIIDSW